MLRLLVLLGVLAAAATGDKLRVVHEWKQVDFAFGSAEERNRALAEGSFQPENNLPLGLEVFGERIFVTVPRWKAGVPASLTYINRTAEKDSPLLHPYPNWEAHNLTEPLDNSILTHPKIVSPFRLRADRCARLWVLDSGIADLLGQAKILAKPRILIYNLNDDRLLRQVQLPTGEMAEDSFFVNIAVEDDDCEDAYAYLADTSAASLMVYSWKQDKAWRTLHHYYHIDPLAGEFNVSGIPFQWTDGVFGLALSPRESDGHATLYFHPMTSFNEFSVSTKYLKEPEHLKENFKKFSLLGTRGPNGQSSVSFLDKKTGVLFYALVNLNAIACWKTSNPSYTLQSQGRVHMSNVTMVFPNDIKVDSSDQLWVLSNRLPIFMYSTLDPNDVNFRILSESVADAIKGTACDAKLMVTKRPKLKTADVGMSNAIQVLPAIAMTFLTAVLLL